MSTWHPISTAPKDRPIDGDGITLWSKSAGLRIRCYWWQSPTHGQWQSDEHEDPISDATHWREPDKGPGMEEGEVRWMVEAPGFNDILIWRHEDLAKISASVIENGRVVRVRIVREGE